MVIGGDPWRVSFDGAESKSNARENGLVMDRSTYLSSWAVDRTIWTDFSFAWPTVVDDVELGSPPHSRILSDGGRAVASASTLPKVSSHENRHDRVRLDPVLKWIDERRCCDLWSLLCVRSIDPCQVSAACRCDCDDGKTFQNDFVGLRENHRAHLDCEDGCLPRENVMSSNDSNRTHPCR